MSDPDDQDAQAAIEALARLLVRTADERDAAIERVEQLEDVIRGQVPKFEYNRRRGVVGLVPSKAAAGCDQ